MAALEQLRSADVSSPLNLLGKTRKEKRMASRDNGNNILQATVAASSDKICAMLCFFSMQKKTSKDASSIYVTLFFMHICLA